ncbi:hypothetical protein [Flavobacterium sp.]|uniref:hypothetical protein n=1 Tax=Flavobacterium sp. TaxID=239 RepID=UPI0037C0571D
MSKKFKFLARFLVLTVFVTFVGCNEELYDVKDQHNGVDKNKISLAQFKNETNIGKVEPILCLSTTKSISSKTKTQLSDFVIDTLAIKKHISENNKTTYSFRIYPLSAVAKPNEIYNLVYRLVNGNWEKSIFYLLKKEKVAEDHKLFEKIELIYGSTINKIATSKTSSFEMCTIETIIWNCTNTGKCKTTGSCDLCAWCLNSVIRYAACSSGGGGGGGSYDPGNTSGSGAGASDPYSYSPNYFDNPVYDDPEYINAVKRSYIWTNLGDAAQGFFASTQLNMNYFNETIQYQIINTWSPESYVVAEEMRIRKLDAPIIFNSVTPFLIEKKIDDTQLNACLKGIMEKLKMATNSDIANVMAKLDATNLYNLTMKMGTVNPGNYAATTKVSKNNYLVTVTQNDFTTASKLYRATSLLHETIHAYMLSVVDDYNTYPTNAPFTDFPELFKIYVSKINNVDNAEIAQHEDMANKYVDAIASALEEYQISTTGLPSSLADKQVFLDMAWSGLQNTDVFDTKFPLGSANRARILARIGAELNGVYSQGQYAVGQPCN